MRFLKKIYAIGLAFLILSIIPNYSFAAQCKPESKHKAYLGTKQANHFGRTSGVTTNTTHYGLKGNDRFYAPSGVDCMTFVGGPGNDYYMASTNSSMTVIDNSGRQDMIDARGAIHANGNSFSAQYLNKHLLVLDADTSSLVALVNWKSKPYRIEKYITGEGNVWSYNTLKRNVLRGDGYLGNLSRNKLRGFGIDMPSSAAAKRDLRYVLKKEKRFKNRRLTEVDDFSTYLNDGYGNVSGFSYNDGLLNDELSLSSNVSAVVGSSAKLLELSDVDFWVETKLAQDSIQVDDQPARSLSLGISRDLSDGIGGTLAISKVSNLSRSPLDLASTDPLVRLKDVNAYDGIHLAVGRSFSDNAYSVILSSSVKKWDSPILNSIMYSSATPLITSEWGVTFAKAYDKNTDLALRISQPERIYSGSYQNKLPTYFGDEAIESRLDQRSTYDVDMSFDRKFSDKSSLNFTFGLSDIELMREPSANLQFSHTF